MRFIPEISLHGSGETITLSNTSEGDYILMQGSDGLGMGPREISTVALPSGGSLVRHRRREEAEVQLPIFLGGTERGRWDLRRKLERLIRDEVEIRVTRPSGVYRSRFGYYKSGLEGSYGEGEDAAEGQKLVLEFLCPGGLWQGEEQTPNFRLSGLRKRFLSDRAEPVPTGRENLTPNPSFESNMRQNGIRTSSGGGATYDLDSSWSLVGSQSVKITPSGSAASAFYPWVNSNSVESAVAETIGFEAGKTYTVSATLRLAEPQVSPSSDARKLTIGTVTNGSQDWGFASSEPAPNTPGEHRVSATFTVPEGAMMFVRLMNGSTETPAWWDGLRIEEGETGGEYRDGDSPFWGWAGERHNSPSIEFEKESTYNSPFLPIVLASSTVQGEILINIGGDAPVYPTWVIDGPGKDLIIENDKGDSIKVLGEITDQITIVTDPLHQDITSPDNPDGELWENVPTDSVFFPLEPGEQRIKMSMVDAKPNSLVQCFYRENFLAGW